MEKKPSLSSPLLYSFILALISLLLWNADVIYFSGWLGDPPLSVFLICPVIAVSLILPLVMNFSIKFNRIYFAVALIFLFSLTGFFVAFHLLQLLYHEPLQEISTEKFAIIIFYTALLFSVFSFLCMRILLHKISAWSILFILLALFMVLPVSILIYKIIPSPDSGRDIVQTVRFGIPVFFINILFTVSTYISLKLTK